MRAINVVLAIAILALGTMQLSCTVNQYCLGCDIDDASGSGSDDAMIDGNGSGSADAMIDAGCVPNGPEICDGVDNDCNGLKDDGVLPQVGTACPNVMGACAGGLLACTNGAIKCDKSPMPEQCDGIDNNCNGVIDDGNPGGGGKCGTDQGECIAGTLLCAATAACDPAPNCDPVAAGNTCCVTCVNFIDHRGDTEVCNAKDDDCDGGFDEMVGTLGSCGPNTNVGECNIGTLVCQGGTGVCTNAIFPKFEICNGLDDNCNSLIDEIFDFTTDSRNCGACGNVCPTPSKTCINSTSMATNGTNCTSSTMCMGGTCAINSQPVCAPDLSNMGTCGYSCNPGFIDRDLAAGNGCEYRCFPTGPEVCDGVDNDCDGMVDNGLTAPAICLAGGECGTTAPVATCMGAQGWKCTYPGTTQFPETRCDGLNNDCDANIDENQPNLNQACDDGQTGVCKGTGTFQCNTASELLRNGPAICVVTMPGQTADLLETCDDKDNDCDGKTDEGSEMGNLIGQDWVTIGGNRQIMKYEASRLDSSGTQQGSKAGVVAGTIAASPTGATATGTTATFTTLSPHGLTAGTKVRVSGVGVSAYNGLWTIATAPTTTTFTVTLTTSGPGPSGGGTATKFVGACSKAGSIPWTNVTYPEALAVCESMGASLCSETRWHQACSVVAPKGFPVAVNNGTTATSGTLIEAEDFLTNVFAGGPEVACAGAVDDDGDGRANDGCPAVSAGGSETGAQCTNNTDDDFDGRVNDGCPIQEKGAETGAQCNNNTDDDGDGIPNDGCPAVQRDGESGGQCTNNNDDDADGRINDGCPFVSTGVGPETGTNCSNSTDNDNDGWINDGCPIWPTTAGVAETNCADNIDDDADGRVNDGCPTKQRDGEDVTTQCNNNTDDDNDGRINDGCPVVSTGVGPETGTQCSNTIDDDNDGRANDGCAAVIVGAGAEVACADNIDDDADGFVNDGCPQFIGGGETGAQCDNNLDDDGDTFANDGCPSWGPQAWEEDYTPANANLAGPQQNSGIADMRALPNTGAFLALGNALAQSPHLDYRVTLPQAATNWRIWVRMYSPTGADDTVHISVSPTAAPVAPTTSLVTSVNGQWVWMSTGDLNLATGDQYISLFMGDDGLKVDAIFIARSGTPQPPTALNGDGGTWSYATNADTYQPATCNGLDRTLANDDILATGAMASCYADHDGAGTVAHVFDMSGNVKEWTLARLPGQNPIRGGSSNDTATGTSCSLNFILGTDTFFFPNVGFRCCK